MFRGLLIIAGMLLLVGAAPAQTPSPEAMTAARSLVTTMKLPDPYQAKLRGVLLGLKPVLTQDRPEIERDFDALVPTVTEASTPYLKSVADEIAAIYASNFTVAEMREMEAFYRKPVGQKLLEKAPAIAQQSSQAGQEASQRAADDLRARLTEALRQKGHKF